ncbi:MAG TPA: 50S ribosomal protein L13 [Candidatus Eisenbacteria bacterium]|jgi:large subunit ribosomal protein L13|nr:50S ribosomal protein L13 [Candidatus Eisenbacteria bacterium]HEU4333513.1 50S ribosomal protein L13 [Candidatus Eisenbacteria bacterium]
MGTYSVRASEIHHDWFVVNAEGLILGRLATEVASVLKGKRKPTYSPHLDVGDHVIVINADKVRVTGRKRDDKMYFRHSLYPGGHTLTRYRDLQEEKPEEIIRLAVKGMMPRNRLGRAMMKKLKIYAGAEHPHTAQQPKPLPIAGSTTGGE